MKINHLDLFSGIGGFHLGFERAGFKIKSYFSEIDKHAIAVYKHKFKNSTYVGSVTDVRGADLPKIDLITFGSPCQDFSIAGSRQGMEGSRSGLITEAIRLIRECRPKVFVWENVKGVFSSNNGADFTAILQEFANIGGYRLEWQLLNTSWFLPQNRERIYLVGYSTTTKRDWGGVFPIAENDRKALELQGQCVPANTILQRYTATANGTYIGERELTQQVKQIGTKLDSNGGTHPYQQDRVYDADGILPALNQGKSDLIVAMRGRYDEGFRWRENNLSSNLTLDTPVYIKSATLTGYEIAVSGDGINFSYPDSKTGKGKVGKQRAQTLDTGCNQGVLDNHKLRRLTPIECERLQGFPDNHTLLGEYDGVVKEMSSTQRYKQCGNAVTVDVVKAVAEKLKPLFK